MKILIIHTYYHIRGGEDQVFERELTLLSSNYEIQKLVFKNNTGIKGLFQFFKLFNNNNSNKIVEDLILDFKPDIVHIHNLHFAAGLGIINTIKKYNVPLVMTLHNYRLLCPSGTLYFKNKLFLNSLNGKFPFAAVLNKVYKNSIVLSAWLGFVTYYFNLIKLFDKVDCYIVLTEFSKSIINQSGFRVDKNKIKIKPHFVENKIFSDLPKADFFLFVGRLSEEKGIDVLLSAFKSSNNKVVIVGNGPLKKDVEEYCILYPNNFDCITAYNIS